MRVSFRKRGLLVAGTVAVAAFTLLGQSLLLTSPASAQDNGEAKPVPHAVVGFYGYNCVVCHSPSGGMVAAPADHADRSKAACQACHAAPSGSEYATRTLGASVSGASVDQFRPTVGHSMEGHEDCTSCHVPESGDVPTPADHAGRTNQLCLTCHPIPGSAWHEQPAEEQMIIQLPKPTPAPAPADRGRGDAPAQSAPSAPAAPSSGGMPASHASYTPDMCKMCH